VGLADGARQEVEAELRDEIGNMRPEEAAVMALLQRRLAENPPEKPLSTREQLEASAALLEKAG
jgi:hypothetical protein